MSVDVPARFRPLARRAGQAHCGPPVAFRAGTKGKKAPLARMYVYVASRGAHGVGRAGVRTLLAALAAVPVLLAVAVYLSGGPGAGNGPAFLDRASHNGVFTALAGLAVTMPFFIPLSVAVVAGDAIAGEASLGTLRYLLVRPAGRTGCCWPRASLWPSTAWWRRSWWWWRAWRSAWPCSPMGGGHPVGYDRAPGGRRGPELAGRRRGRGVHVRAGRGGAVRFDPDRHAHRRHGRHRRRRDRLGHRGRGVRGVVPAPVDADELLDGVHRPGRAPRCAGTRYGKTWCCRPATSWSSARRPGRA